MLNTRQIGLLLIAGLLAGCIKPYMPNVHSPVTGYLVVEGNINAGAGPTLIQLGRTQALTDTASPIYENGASVTLECSDGTTYAAIAAGNGQYTYGALPLDSLKTYRLDITTADGTAFRSDFVPVIPTPPIDTISNTYLNDGMTFYVNTHNPAGNTRYYVWNFTETWEYHSAEQSFFQYDKADSTVVVRPDSLQIYTCYRSDVSTTILIYSTAKLGQDVVSQFPLLTIPNGDQRLSVEYSMLLSQYGLSEPAYNYFQLMQSNTETLGTIFDPLPTSLVGNIHCLTVPSQTVIGFVNVSAQQQHRIFLSEPTNWNYLFACPTTDIPLPDNQWAACGLSDSTINLLDYWFYTGKPLERVPLACGRLVNGPISIYIPIDTAAPAPGFFANTVGCIDCRTQGGVTTPPSYWP